MQQHLDPRIWLSSVTNIILHWVIPRPITPQGNGLAESSKKKLVNIIKKLLKDNKKSWHTKLVHALWADRLTLKKSIGMSPYQLVYGTDAIFPTSLGVPIMKLIQEVQFEENDIIRRIN